MMQLVITERHDAIGVVKINHPPVNSLCSDLPAVLLDELDSLSADHSIAGIVLIGEGQAFMAGADIRELQEVLDGKRVFDDRLQKFLDRVEASPKPILAAVHGFALGAGLELAMACHWRFAHPSLVVGQPEIELGLIPGAAGTQRLPRLTGVATAARLCSLGDKLTAPEALQLGIVDDIADQSQLESADEFLQQAIAKLQELIQQAASPRRTSKLQDQLTAASKNGTDSIEVQLDELRTEIAQSRPGELAPQLAVDAVAASLNSDFELGCQRELELFDQCIKGPQCRALIRVFFEQRKVGIKPYDKSVPPPSQIALAGESSSDDYRRWTTLLDKRRISFTEHPSSHWKDSLAGSIDNDSLVLLVSPCDQRGQASDLLDRFTERVNEVRTSLPDSVPLLVEMPEQLPDNMGSDRRSLHEDLNFSWLSIPMQDPARAGEITFNSHVTNKQHDRICQFARQLRFTLIARSVAGRPAIAECLRSATKRLQMLISKGASSDRVRQALAQAGFRQQLELDSTTDHSGLSVGDEEIVAEFVSGWQEGAMAFVREGAFESETAIDMLSILGGGFPAYRGGPCWAYGS